MRDYGKAKQGQKPGYGKGTKEGPTKAHSKTTQAFAGGGPAKKAPRLTADNKPDKNGEGWGGGARPTPTDPTKDAGYEPDPRYGPELNDTGFGASPQPTMKYTGTPTASAFDRWTGTPSVPDPNGFAYTRFNGPTPKPNPRTQTGVGGPLGPRVPGLAPQVAHAKVTAPGAAVQGAQMGSGQPAYNMTDQSGFGSVRDDYGYGANAGHGYGTHDYGVGAQHAGRTFDDNYGFTDFSQNLSSAPENTSGGNSSGGGSSGGGMSGGSGGFGGADQESKG